MKKIKYKSTEKFLKSSEKFKINLGLDRINFVLNLLDNPQEKIKVIHVAGTNGKGSVCTITARILREAGYKTGLYTSPHLYDYTERIKINDINISEEKFSQYIFDVEQLAKNNETDLTEFEIITAAAYKFFYDEKVDIAVIETGLGGRFDATNTVSKPLVSVITSISIDHKDRLGDTIEKIAFEKAGIIKKNIPVIVNKNNNGFKVIENTAKEKNSPLIATENNIEIKFENETNFAVVNGKSYVFSLWGLHQKQNLSQVFAIIELLKEKGFNINEDAVEAGLKNAYIPARFEYNKDRKLILDGSHNADAARMLRANLDFYFPNQNFTWVYGALSTKEYDVVEDILFKKNDEVYLLEFNNKLSVPSSELLSKVKKNKGILIKNCCKNANILNKIETANIIIITGSFYMIGELKI